MVGAFHGGSVTSHSNGKTISNFPHVEGITLGAGEVIYEIAGMGLDKNELV